MTGGFAEIANDADVLGVRSELLLFEPGTVGWESASPHFDSEDGTTLVRVTLFRGKTPAAIRKPGVAQGYEVPREAVDAALAYYQRYRPIIDERIAANNVGVA